MKVLILSCNNGGGHNSVAQALAELFTERGDQCAIRDCLAFISDNVSEAVARSHNFMYRHAPEVFDSGYRHSEQHPEMFREHHRSRRLINLGKYQLGRLIREEGYELVLCTHVFAAMMLTAAVKKYALPVVTGVVETDYTCTPGAAENGLDWHFVPDGAQREELMGRGVAADRILVTGIPVRRELRRRRDRREAKAALGLDPEKRHLLVMGGSMGCGPIPKLVEELTRQADGETEISVLCGSNEPLRRALEAAHGGRAGLHIHGYVEDISLLMDSAELLLTKPGGISTTEAAVKGLPMVLINAVAGCEAHNLAFFTQRGAAATADTEPELAALALRLLKDGAQRERMTAALGAIARDNDSALIYAAMHRQAKAARSTPQGA